MTSPVMSEKPYLAGKSALLTQDRKLYQKHQQDDSNYPLDYDLEGLVATNPQSQYELEKTAASRVSPIKMK